MRYISSTLEEAGSPPMRIVGLCTSLANAKDLGEWIGATSHGLFNFPPGLCPDALGHCRHNGLGLHTCAFVFGSFPVPAMQELLGEDQPLAWEHVFTTGECAGRRGAAAACPDRYVS